MQDVRGAAALRYAAARRRRHQRHQNATLAHAAPGQPVRSASSPGPYRFWGREAVLEHFRENLPPGAWRPEPDLDAMRIIPLGADAAQIFVPTRVTFAPGGVATTQLFLINKLVVRTAEGWRIAMTVVVPAS